MPLSSTTTHINLHVKRYPLVGALGETSPEKVVLLTLARQKKANALTRDMVVKATTLLEEFAEDPCVRLLVISGEGSHFCAGADLGWLQGSARGSEEVQKRDGEILSTFFQTLATMPIPVMAVVQGTCAGGGVGVVSLCDSVMVHHQAQFFLGEVRMGLIPAVIYPYLSRNIPARKLRWWALTGQAISAKEAQAWGLCDEIFSHYPEKMLHREITTLLSGAPKAQAMIKRALSASEALSHTQAKEHLTTTLGSEECGSGLQAFHEKKSPLWLRELAEDLKLAL